MADKTWYQVGDGFFDAHGRAVNEDGTLLDPSADESGNLSLQEAIASGAAVVEPVKKEAAKPAPAPAKPAPTPAKKK